MMNGCECWCLYAFPINLTILFLVNKSNNGARQLATISTLFPTNEDVHTVPPNNVKTEFHRFHAILAKNTFHSRRQDDVGQIIASFQVSNKNPAVIAQN
jgi:hypothetical protein